MPENTTVGYIIQQEMQKRNWKLRDVAAQSAKLKKPFSYEHLRKIIKGTTNPSLDLLTRIAKVLDLDVTELTRHQVEASVSRQYGREFLKTLDISPEMYEMDKLMRLLHPTQRNSVMMMIRSLAQGNASEGSLRVRRAVHRPRRKAS